MPSWPMLVRKRCERTTDYCARMLMGTFPAQDFAAAEKKALKVGAKKFFLEVRDCGARFVGHTLDRILCRI